MIRSTLPTVVIILLLIGLGVFGRSLFNRQPIGSSSAPSASDDGRRSSSPSPQRDSSSSATRNRDQPVKPLTLPRQTYPPTTNSPADVDFLRLLRQSLLHAEAEPASLAALKSAFHSSGFPQEAFGFVLKIYQSRRRSFKVVSTRADAWGDIENVIRHATAHSRLAEFSLDDPNATRIQIDFILEQPQPVRVKELSQTALDATRFELGVDGLLANDGKKSVYFLPGDAYVHSLLTIKQLLNLVEESFPQPRESVVKLSRFQTASYISTQDRWTPLFRGHPVQSALDIASVRQTALGGSEYLQRTMQEDGRFLYYYDAANDTFEDHQHLTRDVETSAYYNDLRHSGGALLLLLDYMETGQADRLESVKKAHQYLLQHLVRYRTADDQEAAYVYYNRKAKLGGSGIFLYVLSEYRRLSGDTTFAECEQWLVNHLLASIQPSGEFIYYHIHLDSLVTPERNRELFSFFYPGEALCGLIAYYKNSATAIEQQAMRPKIQAALQFLFVERPKLYPEHFAALPSDSWLMIAINDLWDVPELQSDAAKEFVFQDAEKMVSHMYRATDGLYPDYRGAFYYNYGDFPYADGARAEGLLAAYQLSLKCQDADKSQRYLNALLDLAWATLHLSNTPESVYSVPNPELSIGGIRFKHTRQWFRVDTIQHVAGFYLKFLPNLRQLPSRTIPESNEAEPTLRANPNDAFSE